MIFHFIFVAGILVETLLQLITSVLNLNYLKHKSANQPTAFQNVFSIEHLQKTYQYLKEKLILLIIKEIVFTSLMFYIIYSDIFFETGKLINLHNFFNSPVISNLIFLAAFSLILFFLSLPFQIYNTFYIEKKFGFSTITVKTFILDNIKVLLLSTVLGGIILGVIFKFILMFETTWWLWAWAAVTLFSLIMLKIFPTFIAPLFNKFSPLEEGELKNKIMEIAVKAKFSLTNILKSDASKRSTHSNAYFTGFGKNKQVVLFDTLIEQLEPAELAMGFETTVPITAQLLNFAIKQNLQNFKIFSAHKTVIEAMETLLLNKDNKIDAFICPGHVSSIIGSNAYKIITETFNIPCVISGFEPIDILYSVYLIMKQLKEQDIKVENAYKRGVHKKGNVKAQKLIYKYFYKETSLWRGIGLINNSGLELKNKFKNYNINFNYSSVPEKKNKKLNCICGLILQGLKKPYDCKLFGKLCTPLNPVGACMVSSEGACAAYYKAHKLKT